VGREVAHQSVRERREARAWVRDCSVRRAFPGALEVSIESHAPLARWDDERLVSVRGEVFAADYDGELPGFAGPEGTAPEMATAWKDIARAAAPLASPIAELRLSERRAWQAKLASGLVSSWARGRRGAARALRGVWPRVAAQAGTATHADLRYPNGFALRGVASDEKKIAPKGRRA